MMFDRRTLLRGTAGIALSTAAGSAQPLTRESSAPAAATAPTAGQTTAAAPFVPAAPPEVTRILARYLVQSRIGDIPPGVRKESTRTLLNWAGCGIGGSRHPAVSKAIAALGPFSGPAEANVLGRSERFDVLHAALLNGISSHVFDYDDTHLKTIIHPAGPVASAILALAQRHPVAGCDFQAALVLGIECECRIGNAVYPSHYDMGWHITGSCGTFGSAAACARLLGLDERQMAWALGLAASQPVGLKIQFGSMTKSFHPGRAAQNGMTAALLAAQGFSSDETSLEGKDGWAQALSRQHEWREVTEGLGTRYEAALNTYKPFACGIVTHPGIDAAVQLRNENGLTVERIESVELRVNPLVLALTGKSEPRTGLEGKFSIYHCIAVAIAQGAAGERQFSDRIVLDPGIVALRRRVNVIADPAIRTEQADMTIRLTDGKVLSKHIEHAIGSLERPMSDEALEAKFADLADGILPPDRIRRVMDLCWNIERLADAGEIARAGAPA